MASKLVQSSSPHSVADAVFVGRIKSRVRHWLNACKESNTRSDGEQIATLYYIYHQFFSKLFSCHLQMH